MAKKKPQKQNIPSKRAKFVVGISILVFLAAGAVMQFWYPNYKDKKRAEQIIADVESVKKEMEDKSKVTFTKSSRCTQNQGKYDDENSGWGCSLNINSSNMENYDAKIFEDIVSSQKFLEKPFSSSNTNKLDTGYHSIRLAICGTHYVTEERFMNFGCTFQVENANIAHVKKLLEITE
ncbi:MAG: hypothetical protein M3Q79_03540 [bacterium]|nr:hypothetical protein [bacterium]